MKVTTIAGAVAGLFLILCYSACAAAAWLVNAPQYFSPVWNAKSASICATIVVRYWAALSPSIAAKSDTRGLTLGYSWNGATDVAAYRVYGGESPESLALIDQKAKTDFESQSPLSGLAAAECYFQVAAVNSNGNEMARSKGITTDGVGCPLQ